MHDERKYKEVVFQYSLELLSLQLREREREIDFLRLIFSFPYLFFFFFEYNSIGLIKVCIFYHLMGAIKKQ